MTQSSGFIDDFGMDTITLSGSLPDIQRFTGSLPAVR